MPSVETPVREVPRREVRPAVSSYKCEDCGKIIAAPSENPAPRCCRGGNAQDSLMVRSVGDRKVGTLGGPSRFSGRERERPEDVTLAGRTSPVAYAPARQNREWHLKREFSPCIAGEGSLWCPLLYQPSTTHRNCRRCSRTLYGGFAASCWV